MCSTIGSRADVTVTLAAKPCVVSCNWTLMMQKDVKQSMTVDRRFLPNVFCYAFYT